MTRKQVIDQLKAFGCHDLMMDGETLCAYEQIYHNLRCNRTPLKDIDHLELDEYGEIRVVFENGMDYASGYLLEYEGMFL